MARGSSSGSSEISPRVLDYVKNLQSGSHAIFYYDSERELIQVFSSYLEGALVRGEAVHLIVPNRDAYENFLRNAGVADVGAFERDRRLGSVLISDACVDGGRLSSAKAIQSAARLTEEDRELGFRGTRTITPDSEQYYLAYGSESDLLRYERGLGQTFSLPLSAVCAYNASKLVGLGLQELLVNLFEPHGQVIGKGLALPRV